MYERLSKVPSDNEKASRLFDLKADVPQDSILVPTLYMLDTPDVSTTHPKIYRNFYSENMKKADKSPTSIRLNYQYLRKARPMQFHFQRLIIKSIVSKLLARLLIKFSCTKCSQRAINAFLDEHFANDFSCKLPTSTTIQ